MKLSTKIILPIILISALLILLNGCTGTVPTDESPGFTPGTITGIIAAPCCSTSAEPVSETSGSPEYWCYYCQNTWNLQDGIEVVLTYGEDEVATTTTNEDGEYTFTNVDPGKNYVVTAYCPDFADNRPLVKDVALELLEGGSFDTKTTDLVSTSLGLVVDFLVLYTDWGPEDISLDAVLADRPSFPNFPKFKKLIYEVRRVLENCELNLLTDDDVQEALCLAAEEISKLDIGCAPGFTPPPGPGPTPTPGECDGNTPPSITDVTLDDTSIFNIDPALVDDIHLTAGIPYEFCVTATDTDNILPQDLIYYLTIDGVDYYSIGISNCLTITPEAEDVGEHEVFLNVYDGCNPTTWGPITVIVDCCPFGDPGLTIDIEEEKRGREISRDKEPEPIIILCLNECVTISSVTVHYAYNPPGYEEIFDLNDPRLDWTWDPEISFDPTVSRDVCLADGADPGTYTISVTYTDPCGEVSASIDVEFEDCNLTYTLTMAVSPDGSGTTDPSIGDHSYSPGITVPISAATADLCWVFDHWEGDLSGSANPTTITMDSDKTVTAVFVQLVDAYTLTVNTTGNGTVAKVPAEETYDCGEEVVLTATADLCWVFDHWEGEEIDASTTNPETVTMDSNKTVTAVFVQLVDAYTLTVNTTGNGTVAKVPAEETYDCGEEVVLTATADLCWVFDHWEGEEIEGSTNNPETVTMDSDKLVTAVFVQLVDAYTLTVNTEGEGSVAKVPDKDKYDCGEDVVLTATADLCWVFDHWEGEEIEGSTNNPETVTMDSDKLVTAVFVQESNIAPEIDSVTLEIDRSCCCGGWTWTYSGWVNAHDDDGLITKYELTGSNNPPGLNINPTTGALYGSTSSSPWSGCPPHVNVKVKVTDNGCIPKTDEDEFTIYWEY